MKEEFKFINEGNGIEGIIATGKLIKTKHTPKILITDKKTNLIWDPIFECFIPKENETKSIDKKHLM